MQAWGKEHEQMLECGLQKLYSREGQCSANTPSDWSAPGRFLSELQNALSAYGKILLQWQEAFGLLGKNTGKQTSKQIEEQNRHFVDLHLLDSVSGAFWLQGLGCIEVVQIVDVGSGLGLPGIPIALFLNLWRKYCGPPNLDNYANDYGENEAGEPTEYSVFLVEPGSRKAAILRSIVVELQLQQTVCVCEHRVEEWQQHQGRADYALQGAASASPIVKRIVSCRAFRPLNRKSWKQLRTPLKPAQKSSVQTGILLYKGAWETARAELRRTGLQAQQACFFRLPHCGHQRSLFYLTGS